MTLRKLVLSLTLLGSVSLTQAADLLEVYRAARNYDAGYAAASAARDAEREKAPQARAGLLPSIGLAASTTRNRVESTPRAGGLASHAEYNSNGWTISLSQPLFRWQNWQGYQQGELLVANAEARFAQAGQELLLRVTQAYFDVLLAQETVASVQALKLATVEQLASARRNFEVGTATITDTHEAQARHDLIVAQEIAAANDLAVRQQFLLTLTGEAYSQLDGLKQDVNIGRPVPDDMAQWASLAEHGNIGVQVAETSREVARREVEKQSAGHYPTVDLVASHGRSATGFSSTAPGGLDSRTTTIGLQLNLPIFAGGFVSSKSREAVALHEKSRAELENARRQAVLAARQAYLAFSNGQAQIKAFEAGVTSSQLALDANKLGYEVGIRINMDILNAQSQLFDTRVKLVKARLDTMLSLLRLKQAAGILAEEDLAAINTLLKR
ncbi:TolC family outer membrane protein [Azonexus caeni]|uniref:TolC family outer membrane protein n=1 Tax=Azonexus caeni TaxID=266126 RepID=UPI003A86500A